MPTATLTFNLPEEAEEYEKCNKAHDYHRCLLSIATQLRDKIKHFTEEDDAPAWVEFKDLFWETCKDWEIEPYG